MIFFLSDEPKADVDQPAGRCGGKKAMDEARKLRDLAAWYREFAERAGDPWIWDARLRTADKLEKEAALLEKRLTQIKEPASPSKA